MPARGIRNVIMKARDFRKKGGRQKLQNEIDRLARFYALRIIGPNCLGGLDIERRFCCMYGAEEIVSVLVRHPGPVSYILQSGGVAELVGERLMDDRLGVNKMVCIGNKSDVNEADLIDYFDTDHTEVICVYLENVKDGRKLMRAVKKTRKPVLVYKSGKSEAGRAAALSHTAGMAQNDAVFDGACRQAGIIRLQSIEELHALPKMFTRMPLLSGNRIAVFTTSGAFGSVGADLLAGTNLVMAEFSDETKSRLSRIPGVFNAANPVDIGPAPPEIYLEIYNILLTSGEVDGLLQLAACGGILFKTSCRPWSASAASAQARRALCVQFNGETAGRRQKKSCRFSIPPKSRKSAGGFLSAVPVSG
jgi:acyl-CoA synthetase (NDP forming)